MCNVCSAASLNDTSTWEHLWDLLEATLDSAQGWLWNFLPYYSALLEKASTQSSNEPQPSSNYLDVWLLWPLLSVSGQASPSSFPPSPKCSMQPQQWEQSSSHTGGRSALSGELLEKPCSCCRCLWVRGGRRGSRAQQQSWYLPCPAPFQTLLSKDVFPRAGSLPHQSQGVSLDSPSPWTYSQFTLQFPCASALLFLPKQLWSQISWGKGHKVLAGERGGKFVTSHPGGSICVLRSREDSAVQNQCPAHPEASTVMCK